MRRIGWSSPVQVCDFTLFNVLNVTFLHNLMFGRIDWIQYSIYTKAVVDYIAENILQKIKK